MNKVVMWLANVANPGMFGSAPQAFFSMGNKNLYNGADSALGIASLETAYQMFIQQTKPNGQPLGIMPITLLSAFPKATTTGSALAKSNFRASCKTWLK